MSHRDREAARRYVANINGYPPDEAVSILAQLLRDARTEALDDVVKELERGVDDCCEASRKTTETVVIHAHQGAAGLLKGYANVVRAMRLRERVG